MLTEKRNFKTMEEAKQYAMHMAKFNAYSFEEVIVSGKHIILCGTDKAYEEKLWSDAHKLAEDFCKGFLPSQYNACFCSDMATKIRDMLLEEYKKEFNVEFLAICNQY